MSKAKFPHLQHHLTAYSGKWDGRAVSSEHIYMVIEYTLESHIQTGLHPLYLSHFMQKALRFNIVYKEVSRFNQKVYFYQLFLNCKHCLHSIYGRFAPEV